MKNKGYKDVLNLFQRSTWNHRFAWTQGSPRFPRTRRS